MLQEKTFDIFFCIQFDILNPKTNEQIQLQIQLFFSKKFKNSEQKWAVKYHVVIMNGHIQVSYIDYEFDLIINLFVCLFSFFSHRK